MLKKRIISVLSAIAMSFVLVLLVFTGVGCKGSSNRVLLVSIDGMRPDAITNTEYGKYLETESAYSLSARTVYPSVTLPCHMSMFHSVEPTEHGVTDNSYTPSESLGYGIAEALSASQRNTAMFFNWQPIDNVAKPNDMVYSEFIDASEIGWEQANKDTVDACIEYLENNTPDFTFLYLGFLDEWGHAHGWLSNEYYYALNKSLELVDLVIDRLSEDYTIIITTDHGGHDYTHGTEMVEDMTIPMYVIGKNYEKGKTFDNASILDIAPTVLDVLGVDRPAYWKGVPLREKIK